MAILLPKGVPAAIDLNAALGPLATVIGTTMAAGEEVGNLVTSHLITSDGTSYGTGMSPGVRRGAGVPAGEEMDRFVKTIFTVVDTDHFLLKQGNVRAI